nr:MAG TPA: Putative tail length tape measure protein [Caudoviricetes sp.]
MAKEVSFTIKVDDKGTLKKVTMDAEQLGRAVRSVQDESEKAKRSVLTWAETSQAVDVLQSSIGELQGVVSDLTSAYQVQLVAETQIETIMRQRMAATDEQIQSIKNLCSAQQELGVIGDEVQLSGAQQMATFLQNKRSLDVLIPAMNNLVAQQNGLNATNQDAVSIGNMMGKAMQGQVEVLQRVGITFDESQKKVLQYGTESERAAMLAKVITQNVGNMNAELAKTDAGKQKQLENTLGDIKEQMGALVQGIAPYVTMASQITVTITGVVKLTTSLYAATKAFGTVTVAVEAASRAKVGMTAVVRVLTATLNGETVGATTAAVATRALSAAVKGLLISTGVGIAIVALTEAINYLMNSSDEAADKVDGLTEAEQRAKQAHQQTAQEIAGVRSEMDMNILKLKSFKGSKEEEKKLVGEMNTKYGEAMGYYSTVAQWYTALTKNSKMYCDQMINEITLRNLANEAANLRQQQHDILKDENGKTRTYSTKRKIKTITHVSGDDPNAPDVTIEKREEVGSSELEKAQAKYNRLRRRERVIHKRMQAMVDKSASYVHTEGYSATPPSGTGGRVGRVGTTNHTPSVTDKKDDPLKGSIDWYTKAIDEKKRQLYATANEATAKSLNNEMEALQRDLYFLKVRIGVEVPPPIEVKKTIKPMAEQLQESFDDMQKYLKEHPLQVQADPKRLEKLTQKMEDFEKIKGLGNVDLGNFEGVRKAMTDIQGIVDPTAKGFAAAGTACQALGGAMQQLGSDSAAAKAGLVMAAIGQLALSLATAMTDAAKQSWITWLAFGISGTAQLVSMVATISQFATGGIVGGNSKSGDRVLARVNSGEMILNAAQQAQLFAIANGRMQPTVNTDVLTGLMAGGAGGVKAGSVVGKIRGRDIVLVTANETRQMRRRSNIKI